MSTSPDPELIAELHRAEKERLSQLPDFPSEPPEYERGVLLSDRIEYYCKDKYELISPFYPDRLRPAGYALSVGRHYSIGGEWKALSDGMSLTIKPYQVAIIETYETLNMPRYLIGRWNIQTKRAYQGLLWVGGAQVDPGFRGYLCCPIYNLSNQEVTLGYRDTVAVIDFVTTTRYKEDECLPYDWEGREKLIYLEYGSLESGIEHEVKGFNCQIKTDKEEMQKSLAREREDTEQSLRNLRSQIDNFVAIVFAVVAVLFTGLGIVATTTSPEERSISNFSVLVSAVALWFALWSNRSSKDTKQTWYALLALLVAGALATVSIGVRTWEARVSEESLEMEREARQKAVEQLRAESDANFEGLQQQINDLRETSP